MSTKSRKGYISDIFLNLSLFFELLNQKFVEFGIFTHNLKDNVKDIKDYNKKI